MARNWAKVKVQRFYLNKTIVLDPVGTLHIHGEQNKMKQNSKLSTFSVYKWCSQFLLLPQIDKLLNCFLTSTMGTMLGTEDI